MDYQRLISFNDLHPVFQMNLPESSLREAIELATAKQYGSGDLTMLALLGPNQIGRLACFFVLYFLKFDSKSDITSGSYSI